MVRPLIIEFLGALCHVSARCNARQLMFRDYIDRSTFYDYLAAVVERFA